MTNTAWRRMLAGIEITATKECAALMWKLGITRESVAETIYNCGECCLHLSGACRLIAFNWLPDGRVLMVERNIRWHKPFARRSSCLQN